MILVYVNAVLNGELDPSSANAAHFGFFWAAIIGSLLVALGILLEAHWPFSRMKRREKAGIVFVVIGVVLEASFTFALLTLDEGIAKKQNKTILEQQSKIIALENEIAPRRLSDSQQRQLGQWLAPFSGKTVKVSSYALDIEAAWLGQKIIQSLRLAGINTISDLLCEAPVGSLVLSIHVTGTNTELVSALLRDLAKVGLIANADPVPPSMVGCGNLQTSDATIFVAIKLPPE